MRPALKVLCTFLQHVAESALGAISVGHMNFSSSVLELNNTKSLLSKARKTFWVPERFDCLYTWLYAKYNCRALLAVVGPAKSGKTSLVSLIGGDFWRRVSVTGSLIINGQAVQNTWVKPTFICATDQPMAGITVEQALIYTGDHNSLNV